VTQSVRISGFHLITALTFLLVPAFLHAQSEPPMKAVDEGNGIIQYEYDTNKDGRVDLVVRLDAQGKRVSESVDFNHDGKMDDFYTYRNGVLVSREVDTNFDGKVDLRVWLKGGIYVTRYERDLNFDGKPDIVKVFESDSPQQDTESK